MVQGSSWNCSDEHFKGRDVPSTIDVVIADAVAVGFMVVTIMLLLLLWLLLLSSLLVAIFLVCKTWKRPEHAGCRMWRPK